MEIKYYYFEIRKNIENGDHCIIYPDICSINIIKNCN